MRMRACIALAIAVAILAGCATPSPVPTLSPVSEVIATPAASGKGIWTAETGIYGTNFHYGPLGYICGVGFDLSYVGGAPLVSVDVGVLFADAFATHVTPSSLANGWQRPTAQIASPSAFRDSAWLSQQGGAVGGICNNGPADLDSLRGSIVKVSWATVEGSYEQVFQVDKVRGEMMACVGQDGRIRIVWTDARRC
jgi:hypothetical protein